MKLSHCPTCGCPPEGTVETVPAIAQLVLLDDGTFEYEGYTRVCWDGQTTDTDSTGGVMLWCDECSSEYVNTGDPL